MANIFTTTDIPTLAKRIVNFSMEHDFFGYSDSLEVGQTSEDAQAEIELDLSSGEKTGVLFGQFNKLFSDESLSVSQRAEVDGILEDLTILIVHQLTA